jgi:predicted small lipoprotein YifL
MKKILLVALSLMLIFALVACGGAQGPEGPADVDGDMPSDDYRAMTIIRDVLNVGDNALYMSFTTEFENDLMDVDLYIKGDYTRMDTSDPEYGGMSVISNEAGDFILMHDTKSYIKSLEPVDPDDMDFLFNDEEMPDYEVTTGQEELKGTLYDFERLVEVDEDGVENITTFYFEPGTDNWVALKSEDTIMYVHKISSDVDDSVFVIPSDYQEFTF